MNERIVKILETHAEQMAYYNGNVEGDTNAWVPTNDWIETYLEAVEKCVELVKGAAREHTGG